MAQGEVRSQNFEKRDLTKSGDAGLVLKGSMTKLLRNLMKMLS